MEPGIELIVNPSRRQAPVSGQSTPEHPPCAGSSSGPWQDTCEHGLGELGEPTPRSLCGNCSSAIRLRVPGLYCGECLPRLARTVAAREFVNTPLAPAQGSPTDDGNSSPSSPQRPPVDDRSIMGAFITPGRLALIVACVVLPLVALALGTATTRALRDDAAAIVLSMAIGGVPLSNTPTASVVTDDASGVMIQGLAALDPTPMSGAVTPTRRHTPGIVTVQVIKDDHVRVSAYVPVFRTTVTAPWVLMVPAVSLFINECRGASPVTLSGMALRRLAVVLSPSADALAAVARVTLTCTVKHLLTAGLETVDTGGVGDCTPEQQFDWVAVASWGCDHTPDGDFSCGLVIAGGGVAAAEVLTRWELYGDVVSSPLIPQHGDSTVTTGIAFVVGERVTGTGEGSDIREIIVAVVITGERISPCLDVEAVTIIINGAHVVIWPRLAHAPTAVSTDALGGVLVAIGTVVVHPPDSRFVHVCLPRYGVYATRGLRHCQLFSGARVADMHDPVDEFVQWELTGGRETKTLWTSVTADPEATIERDVVCTVLVNRGPRSNV